MIKVLMVLKTNKQLLVQYNSYCISISCFGNLMVNLMYTEQCFYLEVMNKNM